jgi:hypothetical protein
MLSLVSLTFVQYNVEKYFIICNPSPPPPQAKEGVTFYSSLPPVTSATLADIATKLTFHNITNNNGIYPGIVRQSLSTTSKRHKLSEKHGLGNINVKNCSMFS